MAYEYESSIIQAAKDLYSEKVNDDYGKTLNDLRDVLFNAGVLALISLNTREYEGLLLNITTSVNDFIDSCNTKLPNAILQLVNQIQATKETD